MPLKSLVNTAYDILTKKYATLGNKFEPVPFKDLLIEVGEELGIEEAKLEEIASRFYTDLTLDGRFVIKEKNTWVLREHEKFENIHIDMNDIYDFNEDTEETPKSADEEDEESEDEDETENKIDDEEKEDELGEESNSDLANNADEEYDENN